MRFIFLSVLLILNICIITITGGVDKSAATLTCDSALYTSINQVSVTSYTALACAILYKVPTIYVNASFSILSVLDIFDVKPMRIIGVFQPSSLDYPTLTSTHAQSMMNISSSTLEISNLNLLGSSGSLASTHYGGILAIQNSNITIINSKLMNGVSPCGGAIHLLESSIELESCVFTNCTAVEQSAYAFISERFVCSGGGAIYQNQGVINIKNSIFTDNIATGGGAIEIVDSLSIQIRNTTFGRNIALTGSGGGIRVTNASLVSITNSNFIANAANAFGGGFYYGNLTTEVYIANTIFRNNSVVGTGAAINGNAYTRIINSSFYGNSAGAGGALQMSGSVYIIEASRFEYNQAHSGGAISCSNCNLTLSSSDISRNRAVLLGGAIDVYTNSSLTTSNSIYSNNFCSQPTASHGGFLSCSKSKVTILDTSITGSEAGTGSHIYSLQCDLVIARSNFLHGRAKVSNSISSLLSSTLQVSDSLFQNNVAGLLGGAIGCEATTECTIVSTKFIANVAAQSAGALYFLNCIGTIRSSEFLNNTAASGAAVIFDSSIVNATKTIFMYNVARDNGGAVQALFNSLASFHHCNFTANSAALGGALYALTSKAYIQNSYLTRNSASEQGGAFCFDSRASLVISDTIIHGCNGAIGGVISIQGGGLLSMARVTASQNIAYAAGGVISTFSSVKIAVTNSSFTGNYAVTGGVVNAQYYVEMSFKNCQFVRNIALDFGGVFFTQIYTQLALSDSYFTRNSAQFQGAVIAMNTAVASMTACKFTYNHAEQGSVVFLLNSNPVIISQCQFEHNGNVSTLLGGVVSATSYSLVKSTQSSYANNFALNGGVFSMTHSNVISKDDVFTGNHAFRGGAFTGEIFSNISIYNATASKNTAEKSYGSFLFHQDGVLRISSSIIENGNVEKIGQFGAIALADAAGVISDTIFRNNYASGNGGAIYLYSLVVADHVQVAVIPAYELMIQNCRFIHNQANEGGSIYSNAYNGHVYIMNNSFVSNLASLGGAIFSEGTNMSIAQNQFLKNTALAGGGAIFWIFKEGEAMVMIDLTTNLAKGNYATYGNFTATNPIRLSVDTNYSISDSGGNIPPFQVFVYDYYDQIASNVSLLYPSVAFIYVLLPDSNVSAALRGSTIEQVVNGIATFDQLIVSSVPGDNVSISFVLTGDYTVTATQTTIWLRYCVPGEIIQYSSQDIGSCFRCGLGTYSFFVTDSACSLCPENAYCPGGNQMDVDSGYWRLSQTSTEILQCPLPSSCLGGANTSSTSQCESGHQGPLCDVCDQGYTMNSAGSCVKCTTSGRLTTLILAPILILLFLIFVYATMKYRRFIHDFAIYVTAFLNDKVKAFKLRTVRVKFKILIAFYQIAAQIGPAMSINYPSSYTKYLSVFYFLNFNILGFSEIQCIYDPSFYQTLLFTTLSPYLLVLIVSFLICARAIIAKRMNAKHPSYSWKTAITHIFSVGLYISYIALIPVSNIIFELFSCQEFDDGSRFLVADYSVDCNTDTYRSYLIYGAIMILLYPVGIPLIYAILLVSNQKHVNPSWRLVVEGKEKKVISEKVLQREKMKIRRTYDDIRNISFLFDNYKPKRWYFEIFECFRRLTLGAIPVLILRGQSLQIIIVLLVSLLSVALLMHMEPYTHDADNRLAIIAQWSITMALIGALVIRIDALNEDDSPILLSVVLIIINLAVFLLGLSSAVISSDSAGLNDDDDDDDDEGEEEEKAETSDKVNQKKNAANDDDDRYITTKHLHENYEDRDSDDDEDETSIYPSAIAYPDHNHSDGIELHSMTQNPMIMAAETYSIPAPSTSSTNSSNKPDNYTAENAAPENYSVDFGHYFRKRAQFDEDRDSDDEI
jgi:predicted outer membrane repeat protein